MTSRCPHCNQIMPPRGLPEGIHLSPTQRRIWDAVTSWPGASVWELMDYVYGHQPDNGPESPSSVIVNISQMNKKLRQYGLMVTARGREGYKIQEVERALATG